jgi:phage gp36-like protein
MITKEELKTHLYAENIATISRGDDTLLTAAIDGAIVEAKGYLTAYDIEVIFTAEDSDRNALLLIFLKDIAVWHFLVLSNAGVELELREKRYNSAIAWLKGVQKGLITPDLPTITEEDGDVSNTTIRTGSNPKRDNHF